MHNNNTHKQHNRPPFRSTPVNLNDPMLQHITMMALMSRPGIEKQLEEALYLIEGISNTIRTMRHGMESFHTSMREAQRHMQRLPNAHTYGSPKKENVQQQPQYNKYSSSPLPLDNNDNNSPNTGHF